MRRRKGRAVAAIALGLGIGAAGAPLLGRGAPLLRRRLQARASPPRTATEPAGDAEADADELARLSKQELYRRAQAARIPGRSEMTKEQLIAALRASQQ
jgi:DNA end-binding protein Ku